MKLAENIKIGDSVYAVISNRTYVGAQLLKIKTSRLFRTKYLVSYASHTVGEYRYTNQKVQWVKDIWIEESPKKGKK